MLTSILSRFQQRQQSVHLSPFIEIQFGQLLGRHTSVCFPTTVIDMASYLEQVDPNECPVPSANKPPPEFDSERVGKEEGRYTKGNN